MHKLLFLSLLAIFTTSAYQPAYAKDFGRIGQVYPIQEMDMLDFIQMRLKELQQSGKFEKIHDQMLKTVKTRVERPSPVKGILSTRVSRKWLITPSIAFKEEITDAKGQIIVKAGTVVNPLAHISLTKTLLFYDGDNKTQVAWAMKQDKLLKGRDKLILVRGSIAEQNRIFKKNVFFDQHGRLVSKFKITHTPAIVAQEGMQLRVEELVP
jgi:conjugal transfer pilus assembly protein TraW